MKKKNSADKTGQLAAVMAMPENDARQFMMNRDRLLALNALFDAAQADNSASDIRPLLEVLGEEKKQRLAACVSRYAKDRAH